MKDAIPRINKKTEKKCKSFVALFHLSLIESSSNNFKSKAFIDVR